MSVPFAAIAESAIAAAQEYAHEMEIKFWNENEHIKTKKSEAQWIDKKIHLGKENGEKHRK